MGREGTERLHANTCAMIIPPAQSLLGNVIHHPAAATSPDRGGREGHSTVQIDKWLRIPLVSLLYIPELILINMVIGQQEVLALCLWPFRQRDKCQALQVQWDRKMLIHILHITRPSLIVTALIHHSSY